MEQTLVLNATFEPLKIVDWTRAIVLCYQKKAAIVAEHDRVARAVSFSFRVPSVIRLLRYVKSRQRSDYIPFTRSNIYARDGHICAYCWEEKPTEELTFDHVIPESRGGKRDWSNVTTACVTCNRKKGSRTPEEAGMILRRKPKKPKSNAALRLTVGVRHMPVSWRDWLYATVELEA